jgi:hypothetical protein
MRTIRHAASERQGFAALPDGGFVNLSTIGQIYRYASDELHFYSAGGALVHRERADPHRLDAWVKQVLGARA